MIPAPHLPKTLWVLWFQGYENSPERTKRCLLSWKKFNPGWKIHFLSWDNLADFLPDLDEIIGSNRPLIKLQAISDIIRINLLKRYGGVWIDATCLCRRPLDEWLYDHLDAGFFAFQKPGKDKLVDSWFLASVPESLIARQWCASTNAYWKKNHFVGYTCTRTARLLNRNRFLPIFWSSWYVTKVKKRYPYFWFHYLFARNYYLDAGFRREWRKVRFHEGASCLRLNRLGLGTTANDTIKEYIDALKTPLFKLSSRPFTAQDPGRTVQDYVLDLYAGRDEA